MRIPKEPLPHDVVTEFLGGIAFSKKQENNVAIAEQIASTSYHSMEDLIETCKSFLGPPYNLRVKDVNRYTESCKTNPFFEKYFASYEPIYVVYDRDEDTAEKATLVSGTKQEILESFWDDLINHGYFGGFKMDTKENFEKLKWD